jgi:3-hydroxyphenylacetate 6-hydroxylase
MPGPATWVFPFPFPSFYLSYSSLSDENIWSHPSTFEPTRWIEKPDAPLFTYGLGSRSCSGVSLANRFLYIFFVRLISAFEIQSSVVLDVDPITGCKSYEDLVSSIKRYQVNFKARDEFALREALGR